jgi:hypothetical protein
MREGVKQGVWLIGFASCFPTDLAGRATHMLTVVDELELTGIETFSGSKVVGRSEHFDIQSIAVGERPQNLAVESNPIDRKLFNVVTVSLFFGFDQINRVSCFVTIGR